jgi:CRP-like cAMP-binding protein
MKRLPLVSPLDRALFLKAQPYLDGLTSNVLAALASYTEERFYPAGEPIRRAGSLIDQVIFLASGRVYVEGPPEILSHGMRIEAPGAVGCAHHFAGSKLTPSVHALDDTLCLEIAVEDLAQILEDHFPLLLQMARTSCEQAVMSTIALGDARPPEAGFEDVDQLETPVQLDLVHRLARAKRTPIFRYTNLTVLGELFRSNDPRFVSEGEKLWAKDDPVDWMAFVLDGCFRTDGSCGASIAPSGAMIGAWEILVETPRMESWIAERPSRILPIRKDLFIDLLEDHLEFAEAYLKRINQQVVDAWDLLARRRAAEPAG